MPLDYVGATPTNPTDLVSMGYPSSLLPQNLDQATVNGLINTGFAGYATQAYVNQQDALNATQAYVDNGDDGRLHMAQIDTNGGIAGLDLGGKVDVSRVPLTGTQLWPTPFYTPAAYNSATVTGSGEAETVIYTQTLPDPGYLYQIQFIFGSVDTLTAVDGEPPVLRLRLGGTNRLTLAAGYGSGDNSGWATATLLPCTNLMPVISGAITLYLTLSGSATDSTVYASALNPSLWISTVRAPAGAVPSFIPFYELNTVQQGQQVPPGTQGCWVTLVGGGGGAGNGGSQANIGGSGGGGGALLGRSWIPVSALGPTYTVLLGSGGPPGVAGTASQFISGGVNWIAGGGGRGFTTSGTGGASGTPAAYGYWAGGNSYAYGGGGGGAAPNGPGGGGGGSNGGGGGGGGGGAYVIFTPQWGGVGGSSAGAGGGAGYGYGAGAGGANGGNNEGGGGGGGGGGQWTGAGGNGGPGGYPGGGGGAGGSGAFGYAPGYGNGGNTGLTLIEWQ
jgi:hypothetical protein